MHFSNAQSVGNDIFYENLQSCNCCPYGYHIDLDFVRYCEALACIRPSKGQLKRRDNRLSRKSVEFMLGLDGIYNWESIKTTNPVHEVQIEAEPESPSIANKFKEFYSNSNDDESYSFNANNSPEASAFMHDVLDEVVNDFERTLERTKKKNKKIDINEKYFYLTDYSTIDGNTNNQHLKSEYVPTAVPEKEDEEDDSINSSGSEGSAQALQVIREQMVISLKRMKELEEQVKCIPQLQKQLANLKEEKRQLQLQLHKEEHLNNISAKSNGTFIPQKISQIALESLVAKIPPNSQLEKMNKTIKRDVGTMCMIHTREVGTTTELTKLRSIGINSCIQLNDTFTQSQVNEIIKNSIEKYKNELKMKLISTGTQMVPKIIIKTKDATNQTINELLSQKISKAILVKPLSRDMITMYKPETRTIASQDDRIIDSICSTCSKLKFSSNNNKKTSNFLSLKSLDMPSRSLSFSLGENEKLNIKRKTIGTQYHKSVETIGVQAIVDMDSIGIQYSPISMSKYTQISIEKNENSTNTNDLIRNRDKQTNTENLSNINSFNKTSDNNIKLLHDNGIFNKNGTKDENNKCAHISISCADNYCDSCKDTIKGLAREFSKGIISPTITTNVTDISKIPRPKTLTSPRPDRKKLFRQNTYTVAIPTPVSIPLDENHLQSEKISLSNCSSLDSVSTVVNRNVENDCLKSSSELESSSKTEKLEKSLNGTQNCEIETFKNEIKEQISSKISNSSHQHEAMLLSQIATTSAESRIKVKPSKEMKAALKVINDSLQKSTARSNNLKSANNIVQKEWFKISSIETANPLDVEDYLDCFEEFSNSLIKYVVNMSDSNGNTAMHYAVSHGNFDVVSILLDSKVCNVNHVNNAGYTCVMLVSLAKLKNSAHQTVVRRLFQMADVNVRAKKHCQTALMLAVSHGNIDMVELLLDAGADINIQDEDGSTALMCAAEHGRIDIIKHLLSQPDCDSLIQDVDGSTAFKIAWQGGHRDIGLLLYVHEQMLRSKIPGKSEQRSQNITSKQQKTP